MYEKAHLTPDVQTNNVIILRSMANDMWDIFDFSDHLAVHGHFQFPEITCPPDLVLENTHDTGTQTFIAGNNISSTETISGDANIEYSAGQCIELGSNFTVELGASFYGHIEGCQNP